MKDVKSLSCLALTNNCTNIDIFWEVIPWYYILNPWCTWFLPVVFQSKVCKSIVKKERIKQSNQWRIKQKRVWWTPFFLWNFCFQPNMLQHWTYLQQVLFLSNYFRPPVLTKTSSCPHASQKNGVLKLL